MDTLVRTSSELRTAFAGANDSDVIKLAPGNYGSVRLRNKDFDTDVTITSAEPGNRAVFDDYLEFNNVSGVTVENIDIEAGSIASSFSTSRIQVLSSQDVTLRDMSVEGHIPTYSEGADPSSANRTDAIAGYGYEDGMRVRWSDGVTLDGIEFSDVRRALYVSDSDGTEIRHLDVHDVREGINLNDVNDTLIENSHFYDFKPFDAPGKDHPDMIQFWGTDSGVHGLVLRDNLLKQNDGWTQSIFGHFKGRPDHVTGSDFTITGNTIINEHKNAIRIREIDGFEISNNLLLPNNADYNYRMLPQITVLESQNGEVTDNVFLPRWDGSFINLGENALNAANIDMMGNTALSTVPGDDLYWRDMFDGLMPVTDDRPKEDDSDGEAPAVEEPESEDDTVSGDDPGEKPSEEDTPAVKEPAEEGEVLAAEQPAEPEEPEAGPSAEKGNDGGNSVSDTGEFLSDSSVIDLSKVDIAGTESRDQLRDTEGNTTLAGLEGGDSFFFDYREDTAAAHDVIVDFSLFEGDRLVLASERGGTFDDSVDPGNNLLVLHGGTRAHLRSEDDLREAAEGGALTFKSGPQGNSLIVIPTDAPDRSIELLGVSPDDFMM